MPKHIRLVNARDLLDELGAPHSVRQPQQIEWLQGLPIEEFYSVGTGKGGRVMITEETAEAIRNLDEPLTKKPRRRPPPEALKLPAPDSRFVTHDEFTTWQSSMEEIIMDQEGRVDQLHKAVEAMHGTYRQLVASVDAKANLPEPPPLPPKFRWRVVIAGMEPPAIRHLRKQFPMLDIRHFGGISEGKKRISGEKHRLPEADLVLLMISYISHAWNDVVIGRYGKENVMKISGGMSSAASAISVWLAHKEKEMQDEIN